MAEITAPMVKELRERTGAGMMECKKALQEANGDMQEAEDIIAKSGAKKAAKTAGRTAAQGRIDIAKSADRASIIEINCETDFVGRDESFIQFCQKVVDSALSSNVEDIGDLLILPFEGSQNIEDARKGLIGRIGENIQIRRLHQIKAQKDEYIGGYIHHSRIGAIIVTKGGSESLAKDLAMQVAAMRPQYIKPEDVPSEIVAKEKEIFMERARGSGKPDNILEKIVQGQLQKHFSEICLIGQPFFKDPDQSVSQLLKANNATVTHMIRFEVGEGIELTPKKSFQEEVASMAKGEK